MLPLDGHSFAYRLVAHGAYLLREPTLLEGSELGHLLPLVYPPPFLLLLLQEVVPLSAEGDELLPCHALLALDGWRSINSPFLQLLHHLFESPSYYTSISTFTRTSSAELSQSSRGQRGAHSPCYAQSRCHDLQFPIRSTQNAHHHYQQEKEPHFHGSRHRLVRVDENRVRGWSGVGPTLSACLGGVFMVFASLVASGHESPMCKPANSRSRSKTAGREFPSPRQALREVLASAMRSKVARNGFDSVVVERIVNPMLQQQPDPAEDAAVLRADALAKMVSSTLKRRWAKESLFQRFCQANRGPRGQVGRGQGVEADAAAPSDAMSLGGFLDLLEAGLGLLAPGMKMSREGAEEIFRSEAQGVGMEEDQGGLQEDGVDVDERGGTRAGTRVGGGKFIGQDGPGKGRVIGLAGFVRCMDMVARWHGLPSLRGGGGSGSSSSGGGGDSRTAQKAGPEAFVRWCTDVEGAISDDDGLVLVDSFFDVLEGVGVIPGAISREDAEEAFGGQTGSIKPLEFRVYSRRIASMLFAKRNHGGSSESILALVAAPSASLTSAPRSTVGDESEFNFFCDCSGLEVGLGKWAQHHLPASSTLRHIWMPIPHKILAKYTDLPFACGEDDLVFEEVDEAGDYDAGLKLLVKFRGHIRGKYGFDSDGHTAASTQEVIYAVLRTQRCSATNPGLAWKLMRHALRLTEPTEATPLYDKAGLRTWACGVMAKHLEMIGRHGAALPWCRAAIKTEKDERCLAWWAMLLSIILSSLRRHEGSLKASQRALQIILQQGRHLDEPEPGEEQGSRLDGTIATVVALHNLSIEELHNQHRPEAIETCTKAVRVAIRHLPPKHGLTLRASFTLEAIKRATDGRPF